MKMQPEHYKHIKDSIAAKVNLPALHEAILKENKYKDFDRRFRWDAFWQVGLSHWAADNLYHYLNDTHIDTALKNIIKEL